MDSSSKKGDSVDPINEENKLKAAQDDEGQLEGNEVQTTESEEQRSHNEVEAAVVRADVVQSADEEVTDSPTSEGSDEASSAAKNSSSKLPWFLFAASLAAIAFLLFTNMGQGGLGGAAATVNGEKVTKEELYEVMMEQGGDTALDVLITEKIIAQEAKKNGIVVAPGDVDKELEEIKSSYGDEFENALAANGLTESALRNQIRQRLMVIKLFEGKVDLSEEKQKQFFADNPSMYGTPEQLEISHILVDQKADADKLLAELKAGADFSETALKHSKDTASLETGGSLGYVSKGQGLDPAFEEAAFKLSKGEISGVVQSSFGYHIIQVTDKKEAQLPSFEEKQEQVREDMVQKELQATGGQWMEALKKEANIVKAQDTKQKSS